MIPRYRAWLKEENKMIEPSDILSISFKLCEMTPNYLCGFKKEKYDFFDLELMQSTGLHDKNGKEIFEGDIIRTSAYGCIVNFGEYTYFEDEHTQITGIGFYLSFLNVTPATYAPFEEIYWKNGEVIGNIHENALDLIVYEAYKYNKNRDEVE